MRLPRLRFALLAAAAWLAGSSTVHAGDGTVVNTFNRCCPPWVKYRFEGAPKLKFKPCCPKPICPCGTLEHFGYYPTCWAPWPFPPDFSHCPVPPPGAMVPPHPGRPPVVSEPRDSLPNVEQGPAPRKLPGMSMNVPASKR